MKTVGFAALVFVLGGIVSGASATEGKLAKRESKAKPLPVIAFSAPADESSVRSTVAVRAASSQVDKVKTVTFLVDGEIVAKTDGPAGAFKWDTTKVGDGWHTLSAVAKDANGKEAETNVAVMVHNFVDKEAPRISIQWPMDGKRKDNALTTRVATNDNIAVTLVETYIDGQLVATSTAAPFDTKWKWNSLKKGSHTIYCKAYDAAGNVATSATVSFTK